MKKIKVTKRPEIKRDFVLKPSRLRIFSFYTLLFGVIFGLGLAVRVVFNPNNQELAQFETTWPAYLALLVGGPILLAVMDVRRWTLTIREGERLEGPAGFWGLRTTIGLNAIDWERTKRSLGAWFKLGNGVYSTSAGQKIMVNPWFYSNDPYSEFLRLLGKPKD